MVDLPAALKFPNATHSIDGELVVVARAAVFEGHRPALDAVVLLLGTPMSVGGVGGYRVRQSIMCYPSRHQLTLCRQVP